jgi:hypothetical protein
LPRLRKDLTLQLPDGWLGDVVDVSATGMRVRSGVMLPIGSEFRGTLQWPDHAPFQVGARVVWVKPREAGLIPLEMGLEMVEPTPEYLEALAELFSEQEAPPTS